VSYLSDSPSVNYKITLMSGVMVGQIMIVVQPAAAGQSGAATPFPWSSMDPRSYIALGNPASAPMVYHFTACSCSSLTLCILPNVSIA